MTRYFAIWKRPCWNCKQDSIVALDLADQSFLPEDSEAGEGMWSSELDKQILEILEKEGAKIEFKRTIPVPEGYLANVCRNCNNVQGDWYLEEEIIASLPHNELMEFRILGIQPSGEVKRYDSIKDLENRYSPSRV